MGMKRAGLLAAALLAILGCSQGSLPGGLVESDGPPENPRDPGKLASRTSILSAPAGQNLRPIDETLTGGRVMRGDAALNVVGVCGYDQDNVSCWDMRGRPRPDLAKEIEKKLEAMTKAPKRHGSIPYAHGKLNRILVTDTISPRTGGRHVNFERLEKGQVYSTFNLQMAEPKPSAPSVMRTGQFFGADGGSTAVSIVVSESYSKPEVLNLEFREGATLSIGSRKATLIKIHEPRADEIVGWVPPPSEGAFKAYLAEVKVDGLLKDEVPSFMVIARPPTEPSNQSMSKSRMPFTGSAFLLNTSAGVCTLSVILDPSKVEALRVGFFEAHRIRLQGIPLKP